RDREDTQERYCRAILTLFVPWRNVSDLCDVNQKLEDTLSSRHHRISGHSQNIIDNIQLLHECKKDRDEHLVKVITEAQVENDTIEPELFPKNQRSYDVARKNYKTGDESNTDDMEDTVVTLINSTSSNMNMRDNYNSILPVAAVISTTYCNQKSVADQDPLNREQKAAFMIITSHLDGDKPSRIGMFMHMVLYNHKLKNMVDGQFVADNSSPS
ncbi:unnamed protein product, partial [Adineta ricciae]